MSVENDALTGRIINAIITVHQELGPGFLENIYRNALTIQLRKQGIDMEAEKTVIVYYDGEEVGRHRLDILVDNTVVLELKTVEHLGKAHYAQLRSYLKASGCKTGLLVNFAGETADFRRIDMD
jgi:GxxExxY protein